MAPTAKSYEALPNFCFVWDHIKFLVDDYTSLKCQVLLIQKFGFLFLFLLRWYLYEDVKIIYMTWNFWLVVNGISFVLGFLKEVFGGKQKLGRGMFPFQSLLFIIWFFFTTNFLPTLAPCYMLELFKKTIITNSRNLNEKAKGKMTTALGNYIPFAVDEAPHPIQSP